MSLTIRHMFLVCIHLLVANYFQSKLGNITSEALRAISKEITSEPLTPPLGDDASYSPRDALGVPVSCPNGRPFNRFRYLPLPPVASSCRIFGDTLRIEAGFGIHLYSTEYSAGAGAIVHLGPSRALLLPCAAAFPQQHIRPARCY